MTRETDVTRVLYITEAMGGGVLDCVALSAHTVHRHAGESIVAYCPRVERDNGWQTRFPPNVTFVGQPALRMGVRSARFGVRAVRSLLDEYAPTLVHLFSSWAGFIGRIGLAGKVPLVYSPQAFAFLRKDVSLVHRVAFYAAERYAGGKGGVILAASRSEQRLASHLVGTRRVRLVENAIMWHPLLDEPWPNRSSVTILGCGRLAPQKDPSTFVRVVAATRDRGVPVNAVWVGDGPLRSGTEELAQQLRVPLRITGWLNREGVLSEMRAATVLLHSARWEGLPLAVLDAFASGLPVCAHACVGTEDAVSHGRTGLVWRSRSEASAQVTRLVREPDYALSLTRAARADALSRFSEAHYGHSLWTCYVETRSQ